MEKKESRSGAVLATILVVLLCGICGPICLCLLGLTTLIEGFSGRSFVPYYPVLNNNQWLGYVFLCLAGVSLLLGILLPFVFLRKKGPGKISAG